MIRRFDQKYDWGTESLTVNVSPDGEISTTGTYNKKEKNPLINIVFEDNGQRFPTIDVDKKGNVLFTTKLCN